MIQLKTKGIPRNISDSIVAKIVSRSHTSFLCYSLETDDSIYLTNNTFEVTHVKGVENLVLIEHLDIGDIVLINPNGSVFTLFRINSKHNSLFITDRCNSNCLMCSQPPKNIDDLDYHYRINTQIVNLIPDTIQELGITGGEPTLLGERFISLLELISERLPKTDIHILTNGRSFAWKSLPMKLSKIDTRNVVFGIPLYSDFYQQHDYIVQAKDAFVQTVRGLHNLARFNQRVEIRIVLHKQSFRRLPELAKFIFMNFPFVEHVAFMGLEYTGYTPYNSNLLWMEPSEYAAELEEAVIYLDSMDMNVSIYNTQLCLLKPTLWRFARKSISDWKRDYLDECKNCNLLKECGGVFATSKKHSNGIKAILS